MMYIAGTTLIAFGMLLVVWATFHIQSAILGEVSPRLPHLVESGPYARIRHPVYLGIVTAMVGVTVFARSWLALLTLLLLSLPTVIYRVSLEEMSLAAKFGSRWYEYEAKTTGFLPRVGRVRPAKSHRDETD